MQNLSIEATIEPLEVVKVRDLNPFPYNVFPQILIELIENVNETLGYEPAYLGMGMLSCTSALIGNRYHAQVKPEWKVPPNFWGVIVGNSSKKKSPALKFALKPLEMIQKDYNHEFEQAIKDWEFKKVGLEKRDLEAYLLENPKPIRKRIKIDDINQEALSRRFADNTHGLLMFRDEIMAWLNSMNQYRSGSDEQFYLSLFDGTSHSIDRVENTFIIENPFLSVIGGIQPSLLETLASSSRKDDGFLFRLLFAYPMNNIPVLMTEKEPDKVMIDRYHYYMKSLYESLKDKDLYTTVSFSSSALSCFTKFANEKTNEAVETGSDEIISVSEKLTGYVPKLALILEVMHANYDKKEVSEIGEESVERAIILIEYFRNNALIVLNTLNSSTGLTGIELEIYNALPEEFTRDEALELCSKIGFSKSTFSNKRISNNGKWMKNKLIERVGQGKYVKLK